ncbi:MAG: homocysteine S-methyltransferase family protein [Gemmatimonadaceae bacterium]|nr:homocysteine S-methyltransferase family protein [Gemmatimonadaceae bacterium]
MNAPMREPLLDVVRRGATVIGDGGMGTELQHAGLEAGGCGDEWNLSHPEKVQAIQRRYVEAGSQIVLTNTFGTNRFVLSRYGLDERVAEIARAAAINARVAAGIGAYVLGDIGPCGGFVEPLGEISEAELEATWRDAIGAMLAEGVDGIIFETMTALEEIVLGIRVARELGAPLIVASMSYDPVRGGGYKTMMGVSPGDGARACLAAGAQIVGANCGRMEPEEFVDVARAMRAVTDAPLILQPNAGQPTLVGDTIIYPRDPASLAPALLELSRHATVIGGCCGTTPAHIEAFAAARR